MVGYGVMVDRLWGRWGPICWLWGKDGQWLWWPIGWLRGHRDWWWSISRFRGYWDWRGSIGRFRGHWCRSNWR